VLQDWHSDEFLAPLESFRFELHSVIKVLLKDVIESLFSNGLAVDVGEGSIEKFGSSSEHDGYVSDHIPI
jgi:hypothetical protein